MAARIISLQATTRTGYLRARIAISKVSVRSFHPSQAALKKKGKATQNASLFDDSDDSDADELFSASATPSPTPASQAAPIQSLKPPPLPRRRVSPSSETGVVDEKAAELLRQKENERRETFQSNYEYLYGTTGDAAKQSKALPPRRALHKLVELAVSLEEWQRVIGILRQWRRYPARTIPLSTQKLFIERTISTGNAPLLTNILTHHPIYGVHVASLPLARALLKEVITPVNSYPPSYEPTTTPKDAAALRERLEQALRLAEVLSITPASTLPRTSSASSGPLSPALPTPKTLSPSTDLALGSLLLSAILRVVSLPPPSPSKDSQESNSTPGIQTDPRFLVRASLELVDSLRAHQDASNITGVTVQPPQSTPRPGSLTAKEAIRTIGALRECEIALGSKSLKRLFDEADGKVDGVEMTLDQMLEWIRGAREKLVGTAEQAERGRTVREKMADAGNVEGIKARPANMVDLAGKKSGKKGKKEVGSHLLGREGAHSSQKHL